MASSPVLGRTGHGHPLNFLPAPGSHLGAARVSHHVRMELAAAIILVVLVVVPAVVVLAMFVWAARQDGQADRAVQARLGIRRRTRLGR